MGKRVDHAGGEPAGVRVSASLTSGDGRRADKTEPSNKLQQLWNQLKIREKEVKVLAFRCNSQKEKMKNVATLKASNVALHSEIETLKISLADRDDHMKTSVQKLNECRAAREEALKRLKKMKESHNTLVSKLRISQDSIKEVQEKLKEREKKICLLQIEGAQRTKDHIEEIETLKKNHSRQQSELIRNHENQLHASERDHIVTVDKLRSEISSTNATIFSLESEVSCQKEEVLALHEQLEICRKEKEEIVQDPRTQTHLELALKKAQDINTVLKGKALRDRKGLTMLEKENDVLKDKIMRQEAYLKRKLHDEKVFKERYLGRVNSKRAEVQSNAPSPPSATKLHSRGRPLQRSRSSSFSEVSPFPEDLHNFAHI